MSPLARVAGLATIATGAFAITAAPAAAAPSAPETPSAQETLSASETPSAQGTPSGSETPSASETPSGSETPSARGTPSAQDSRFLQQAHQTNLAEIAAGRLAQQKGNSQTVKNLGAKFVTDHTRLDHALQQVAQSLSVSLPSAPTSDQQAVANRLKTLSGAQFDNLFVTSQFAGHTQAMQAGQTEIAKGSDPRAIKVASDSAPVIESHHQALLAAAKQLGIRLTATPVPTASATPLPTSTATPVPTASPSSTNS